MMTLLQKTRALARSYDGNVSQLCRESGLKLRWFYLFINKEEMDFGIHKVQKLYDALTKETA